MKPRTAWLVALVLGLSALAVALLWWQAVRTTGVLRSQVQAQAEQRSLHLADAMAGQVEGLLGLLDAELLRLRRDWRDSPQTFDQRARDALQSLPPGFATHISVADAQGRVVYDSTGSTTQTSVSDREHFMAQRAGGDRLVVGKPVMSRLVQGWVVVVNRPLLRDGPLGAFAGTVQFVVSSEFLAGRLAALELSDEDVVALIHPGGVFVARSRDNLRAMTRPVPGDRRFLTEPTETKGLFRVAGEVDGIERTYGWHRLKTGGLVVAIGLADRSVMAALDAPLASARQTAWAMSALLLLGGGFIAWLLVRLARGADAVDAERALRTRLFDSSGVAMVVIDPASFTIVDCNAAAARLYGLASRSEVLGLNAMQVSASTQYDGSRSIEKGRDFVGRAMSQGQVIFEWRHRRPDGVEWDAEVHLMRFESDGKALLQFTLLDITDRRQAQAALKDSEARLKEAQRIARVGSWELDLRTQELRWSDEIYRLFEYDPDQVSPSYRNFIDRVHPQDRDIVHAAYNASRTSRQPYDVVHRLLMEDGRVKFVREAGFTEYVEQTPARSVGTVQDITAVREAEEALRRLNEELEDRVVERTRELSMLNRELEAFAYSVSHDLRTPLRSINGFASLMGEEYAGALPSEARDYLERIRQAANRMGQLIADLLSLAQPSRTELRIEEVDLSELARHIARELAAGEPQRVVQWVIEPGLCAHADAGLMRVVLQNLLGNAWKYTRDTPQARIGLSALSGADGQSGFCVSDNGAGFDMAYANQLFEPFKRLHTDSRFEGTGIGLATVHRVIERHGGWIRGEGAVGEGARFFFSLP